MPNLVRLCLAAGVICLATSGCGPGRSTVEENVKRISDSPKRPKREVYRVEFSDGTFVRVESDHKPSEEEVLSAMRSHARQQFERGCRYAKGQGVAKDQEKAVEFYRKAAEQGLAEAQATLALCCDKGYGVHEDHAEAVRWYRRAADQGLAEPQRNLGVCYELGRGVERDYTEAAKWYSKAAQQGDPQAEYCFGRCYGLGQGVNRDPQVAAKWMLAAASQGVLAAQFVIGTSYRSGFGVQLNYTEAARWFQKAAAIPGAVRELGKLYAVGLGVPKNERRAAELLLHAGVQGDVEAQVDLGYCYELGSGVPEDYAEAYKWFNLAAAQGDEAARNGREALARSMTPQQVAEGQRRASLFVTSNEDWRSVPGNNFREPDTSEGRTVAGTAFFVTDDGYLITCEHVVRGSTSFHVETASGSLPAKLVRSSRPRDIALLKVNGAFQALPVAQGSTLKLGEAVFTIGFPNPQFQGVQPKLTRGEISSLAGMRDNPRYFQISVPVQPGNSGGPLVDECGNAVGVVTARLDDAAAYEISGALPQNVNYALKAKLVREFLEKAPDLSGKLKAQSSTRSREAATAAAERAIVLIIAQ